MGSTCSACGTNAINVLQAALVTLGIVGYVLVLVPLIRYRNSPAFAKPFFRLCVSISICDAWGLLARLIGLIMPPIYSSNYLWPRLMSFWTNITWFTPLTHQLVIAVDRFVALSFPTKEHTVCYAPRLHKTSIRLATSFQFFGGKRLVWSLLFGWLGGLALSVPLLTDKLSFIVINGFALGPNVSVPEAALLNTVRGVSLQPAVLLVIMLLYIAAGLNVRRVQAKIRGTTKNQEEMKDRKNYRAEYRLLLIAALSIIPHSLAVVFYEINIFGRLSADWSSAISFLQNISQILVYAIVPYVYIFFSSEIRTKIVDVYFKSNPETSKTVGGTTNHAPRKQNRLLSEAEQRTTKPPQQAVRALVHVE